MTKKREVANQFGRMAGAYAVSAGHARGPDLPILIDFLQPGPSMSVLDIATGAGHTAAAVAPEVAFVVAMDLAPQMLIETRALARKRDLKNIETVLSDAEAVAFRDEAFDGVTCRIAPHHFLNFSRAINEMVRVLRRGGRVAIEDSCSPEDETLARFLDRLERVRDATHVRSHTEAEWRTALSEVGVKVDRSQIYRKAHPVADWTARSGLDEAGAAAVYELFVDAPPGAREYFQIRYDDSGRAVSFTDDKLIIAGHKV